MWTCTAPSLCWLPFGCLTLQPFAPLPTPFCVHSEWAVNQHRDSYASYLGHTSMLAYFALAHGESQGRLRYNFMQKMVAPCGPKPTEAANQLVADLAPSAQQKRAAMDAKHPPHVTREKVFTEH